MKLSTFFAKHGFTAIDSTNSELDDNAYADGGLSLDVYHSTNRVLTLVKSPKRIGWQVRNSCVKNLTDGTIVSGLPLQRYLLATIGTKCIKTSKPVSFRVVVKESNGNVTPVSDFGSKHQCEKFCKARWGHIPPYVVFSAIKDQDKLKRKYSINR